MTLLAPSLPPARPGAASPMRRLLPLAAALSLVAGGAALAQPQGGGSQSGGSQSGAIARLHAQLHLTAAQEDAWRAFAAASAPDPQQEARERAARQMLPTLTAPQRVDLAVAAAEADLDTLRQHGAALKAFYAGLTPDQRVAFDRATLPREEGDEGGPSY